jgi:hypothetical protein
LNSLDSTWAGRVRLPDASHLGMPDRSGGQSLSAPQTRFAGLPQADAPLRPVLPALGLAYIGQVAGRTTPNETERMYAELLPDWHIVPYGGLDGLSQDELGALRQAPIRGHPTRASLPDGGQIVLSHEVFEHHLEGRIAQMARTPQLRASVVLCTLDFPKMRVPAGHAVIQPNSIVLGAVASCGFDGPLGIVSPLPEQMPDAAARWQAATGREVVNVSVPATHPLDEAAAERAGAQLAERGVGMTVLDCMGYRIDLHTIISRKTQALTLLPPLAVARTVQSMLAS